MKKAFQRRLEALGVFIVYLFGSQASGRGSPLSDVDLGVVLKPFPPGDDHRTLYHHLYALFAEMYPSAQLDIVFLQTAPLSLQYFAIKEGKILFEKDPPFTAEYEESVVNLYLDFQPVLAYFDRVAKEKYAKA